MRIRRIRITRFRGLKHLQFCPGPSTIILGPNNSGKSTVLEALDLLFHPGFGRPRPPPDELDYWQRDSEQRFEIEAVVGDLAKEFAAECHHHLEGWRAVEEELVAQPDGDEIEPVVRVRVRGSPEFEYLHEFAKPEAEGARFFPRLRRQMGWVFDGRRRDPARQLFFYQGGLLDRLFANADVDGALETLRQVLRDGTTEVNRDGGVAEVLRTLSTDLERLGLLEQGEGAVFETGAVSRRALLQTLRLALPVNDDVAIPLGRQGRGAQRLVLMAVLLRLAASTSSNLIGAFEEPEEALEPLRQNQVASMLGEIVSSGGQIFVVTHSPEIARCFGITSFLLLRERDGGDGSKHLLKGLSPKVKQAYERRLDGPVVRGLFCRVPVLVEGPSDRAVFEVFWAELVKQERTLAPFRLGLDVIVAEGVSKMPMLAAVLADVGKPVAAWVDQDTGHARQELGRLRDEGNCAALILHDRIPDRSNVEGALTWGCPVQAVSAALQQLAEDRGYGWEDQKRDLLSRIEQIDEARLSVARDTTSVPGFLGALDEEEARRLAYKALTAKKVTPFEMKGARQARVVAEAIIDAHGVPDCFARGFSDLDEWIREGCVPGREIQMTARA